MPTHGSSPVSHISHLQPPWTGIREAHIKIHQVHPECTITWVQTGHPFLTHYKVSFWIAYKKNTLKLKQSAVSLNANMGEAYAWHMQP